MSRHTPKAFLRGRNRIEKPVNTYLYLLNAKLREEAEADRKEWDAIIKANGLDMKNPITKFVYLHPTKGYRTEAF